MNVLLSYIEFFLTFLLLSNFKIFFYLLSRNLPRIKTDYTIWAKIKPATILLVMLTQNVGNSVGNLGNVGVRVNSIRYWKSIYIKK